MGARLTAALIAVGLLAAAPAALAQVSDSTNWAGYAVHHSGVSFHKVTGVWKEPTVACHHNRQTFSSYWVGLGGYSKNSRALEQTGTEVDCQPSGQIRTFAWYELVPAPAVRIRLKVPPGNLIRGTIVASGKRIKVSLHNLTRHRTFTRVLHARVVDASSAEWIVEAPSDCLSVTECVTLPLGNFGAAAFDGAWARTASGHVGPISDTSWQATAIRLVPSGRSYVLNGGHLGSGGEAAPSPLQPGGSAFTVAYSRLPQSGASLPGGRVVAASRLVHPDR